MADTPQSDPFTLIQGQAQSPFNALGERIEEPEPDEEKPDEAPADPPVDDGADLSPPDDEEAGEPEGDDPEPPPSHPRFNEVYGKWKQTERELQAQRDQLELARIHNERLAQRLGKVEEQVIPNEDPEPDFEEEPKLWREWNRREQVRQERAVEARIQRAQLNTLVEAARIRFDDYDSVVQPLIAEMERTPELKEKIFGSNNPPLAAYRFAKERAEAGKKTKETIASALTVEGATRGGNGKPAGQKPDQVTMTADDRKTAKALGISEKEFLQQKKELMAEREEERRRIRR